MSKRLSKTIKSEVKIPLRKYLEDRSPEVRETIKSEVKIPLREHLSDLTPEVRKMIIEKLANECFTSHSNVYKWLNGFPIKKIYLPKIAEVTGLSIELLTLNKIKNG